MMAKLILKDGGTYRARNGELITVESFRPTANPMFCFREVGTGNTYTKYGRFYETTGESAFDLVSRAEPKKDPTLDVPVDADNFMKLSNLNVLLFQDSERDNNICLEFGLKPNTGVVNDNQARIIEEIVKFVAVGKWTAPYAGLFGKVTINVDLQSEGLLILEFCNSDIAAVRDVCHVLAGRFRFMFKESTSLNLSTMRIGDQNV